MNISSVHIYIYYLLPVLVLVSDWSISGVRVATCDSGAKPLPQYAQYITDVGGDSSRVSYDWYARILEMERAESPDFGDDCHCEGCLSNDCGNCEGCRTYTEEWETPRICQDRICLGPTDFVDPPCTTQETRQARDLYNRTPPSPSHSLAPLLQAEMTIGELYQESGLRFLYGAFDPEKSKYSDLSKIWQHIDTWTLAEVKLKDLQRTVRVPLPEQLRRMTQQVADFRRLPPEEQKPDQRMDMRKEQLSLLFKHEKINVDPGRLARVRHLITGNENVCLILKRVQTE